LRAYRIEIMASSNREKVRWPFTTYDVRATNAIENSAIAMSASLWGHVHFVTVEEVLVIRG